MTGQDGRVKNSIGGVARRSELAGRCPETVSLRVPTARPVGRFLRHDDRMYVCRRRLPGRASPTFLPSRSPFKHRPSSTPRRWPRAALCGLVGWATLACAATASASAWSVQALPPAVSPTGTLSAVSCISVRACVAVGFSAAGGDAQHPLVERWNGNRWSIQPTPSAHNAALSGVSCTSSRACTAVGASSYTRTLVERWDGRSWSVQRTPWLSYPGTLSSVSCTSRSACTAVGFTYGIQPQSRALVEQWNGRRWRTAKTQGPLGDVSELDGVSCTSATDCRAVGFRSFGDCLNDSGTCIYAALAEHWDGSRWSRERIPKPGGAQLSAVSCTSTAACTAVGSSDAGDSVVVWWNGSRWSRQMLPRPRGSPLAISCSSARSCTVVGPGAGQVERLNGARWKLESIPPVPGSRAAALLGVSCPSRTACVAVGDFTTDAGQKVTLAARRSRSGWTVQQTPNGTITTTSNELTGASCTSPTACIVVGAPRAP